MDLTEIPGVGPATERKLHDAGIRTTEDLAETDRVPEIDGVGDDQMEDFIAAARELVGAPPLGEIPVEAPEPPAMEPVVASPPQDAPPQGPAPGAEADKGWLQRLWDRLRGLD